jgi:hypothetical protein
LKTCLSIKETKVRFHRCGKEELYYSKRSQKATYMYLYT